MDFAKRVLHFDVERGAPPPTRTSAAILAEGLKYKPVAVHDDDELAGDEFEREYMFGGVRADNDEDVDGLLNESDWLGLRGGAGPRAAQYTLLALNLSSIAVSTTLLYWFMRTVVSFKDGMYDLALLGVILFIAVIVVAITAIIANLAKAFIVSELTHWANSVLLPLLVLFGLSMVFLWQDVTHYNSDSETIKNFSPTLLIGLVGGQIALEVATIVMNLAAPCEDARKHKIFKATLFTTCTILLLSSVAVAVFSGLTLEQFPLLVSQVQGWSVWTAAVAAVGVAVVSLCGLACTRRSLTAILFALPFFSSLLVAASVFNLDLYSQVPTSSSETGVSYNLQYGAVVALASVPHVALALGTTGMWRRRVKGKHAPSYTQL